MEKFRFGKATDQKKFGEIFIRNAVDPRSWHFYLDFIGSLPLHMFFGMSLVQFLGLILPRALFIYVYTILQEVPSFDLPIMGDLSVSSDMSDLESKVLHTTVYFGSYEEYGFVASNVKSIGGFGLEATQFLLLLQLVKFANLYDLTYQLEKVDIAYDIVLNSYIAC